MALRTKQSALDSNFDFYFARNKWISVTSLLGSYVSDNKLESTLQEEEYAQKNASDCYTDGLLLGAGWYIGFFVTEALKEYYLKG